MAFDPQKVVLYSQDTFDYANPTQPQIDAMLAAAQDINQSGFGAVILGQWHVWQDGSIFYNNTPLVDTVNILSVIVTALKSGGSVQKVLIGFGPNSPDFAHIQANLPQFKQTISGLFAETGIDGIDLDLEQNYCQFPSLLTDLTLWATCAGNMVTAAPFADYWAPFWCSVLQCANNAQCANDQQSPGFSWWNLQLYGGATYSYWVSSLDQFQLVSDSQSFLVPSFNVAFPGSQTPDEIQSQLSELRGKFKNLAGAMIWKYEDFASSGYTAAQFAAAVKAAIDGNT